MWGRLLNEKMKGKNDVDIQIKWKMELSETFMEENTQSVRRALF